MYIADEKLPRISLFAWKDIEPGASVLLFIWLQHCCIENENSGKRHEKSERDSVTVDLGFTKNGGFHSKCIENAGTELSYDYAQEQNSDQVRFEAPLSLVFLPLFSLAFRSGFVGLWAEFRWDMAGQDRFMCHCGAVNCKSGGARSGGAAAAGVRRPANLSG